MAPKPNGGNPIRNPEITSASPASPYLNGLDIVFKKADSAAVPVLPSIPLMKKNLILSALIFLGVFFNIQTVFADALDNWHWRNPLPNGNPQAAPPTLYGLAFANGKFIGVGDGGAASVSLDGTNWTQLLTATTNQLNNIAYLNGTWMAVGNNGLVESSADGTNWVAANSGVANALLWVTYGGGKYLALGTNNIVLTSPDGQNWTSNYWGTNFTQVMYGSGGFLAVNGGSQIYLSSDGLTWNGQTIYNGPLWTNGPPGGGGPVYTLSHQIVTSQNGAYYVGGWRYLNSVSAQPYIFTSTDGVNWNTYATASTVNSALGLSQNVFIPGNGTPISVTYGNGLNSVQYFNGSVWNSANLAIGGTVIYSGAYGNGLYVMVGMLNYYYRSVPPKFTSYDAVNWAVQTNTPAPPAGPNYTLYSIAANSNGVAVAGSSGLMVRSTNDAVYYAVSNSPMLPAVVSFGSGFMGVGAAGGIYQSGDGLSWTQRNSGTANGLHGITSNGSLLVTVGDNGAIQTSTSGLIWTSRSSGTSLPLFGAAYGGGQFVAIGQLGTVLTSPDGISWTGQFSGTLTNLLSVTYGSASFAAVGPGGTIVTSPDGVNWTQQNSGTTASFESITFGNGYYLVTGDSAVALTSPDGINWTPRNLGATSGQNFLGSAFLNSRFDVVGSGGTILESDTINPLFDLQIHSGGRWLTAFAPSGSNFRIQTNASLSATVWSDAASFSGAPAITQWTNSASGFNQLFYRSVSP